MLDNEDCRWELDQLIKQYGMSIVLSSLISLCYYEDDDYLVKLGSDIADAKHFYDTRYPLDK